MKDSDQVAAEALEARGSDYIGLVKRSASLLLSERGQVGNQRIEGRLVTTKPRGDLVVVGDLHGDLESLANIVRTSEFLSKAARNEEVLMVFLGDYGDRGPYSAEIYYFILTLKELFPEKVILMRGNHEGPEDMLAHPYDLPKNLHQRFGKEGQRIHQNIRGLFQYLHTAVIVEQFCVMIHGGVPSGASSIEDLKYAHLNHPERTYLEEILWSDPVERIRGIKDSPRGAGRLFGEDVTQRFLRMLNVPILLRGHEPSENGFRFGHGGRILTLFSRKGPPYFNSNGAYLEIDFPAKPKSAFDLKPYIQSF